MKLLDYMIILIIFAIIIIGMYIYLKKKKQGKNCCGCTFCENSPQEISPLENSQYDKIMDFDREERFIIKKITCKKCALTIEKALCNLEGIIAKVDYHTSIAYVKFLNTDDHSICDKHIIAAIAKEGFIAEKL